MSQTKRSFFLILCPTCRMTVMVGEEQRGTAVRCRVCHRKVKVPGTGPASTRVFRSGLLGILSRLG